MKKSLCGTERLSRLSGVSDAVDCSFSGADAAAAADLAGVSNVDCSDSWTALTDLGGEEANEELVITPEKRRTSLQPHLQSFTSISNRHSF